MHFKSYGVKIFIFEMLISHWSRLWFLLAVNPCDRAVNSFPKWYDTWKSAKKWGYESQISILVIFLSKPKKIKNPWLGGPLGPFLGHPNGTNGQSDLMLRTCARRAQQTGELQQSLRRQLWTSEACLVTGSQLAAVCDSCSQPAQVSVRAAASQPARCLWQLAAVSCLKQPFVK